MLWFIGIVVVVVAIGIVAIVAGAGAVVARLIGFTRATDLGSVSAAWRAEQRGKKELEP